MSEKDSGDCTPIDKFGLTEDKDPARTIRAKFIPLVRALARGAARDWLNKLANDNSPDVTQDKLKPKQE